MATSLKLPYGLRSGQLVHANQVATGLACGCTCPGCGGALVARNAAANVKVAHFAHYQAVECSTGLQTALHLAAKDIIAHHKQLRLPGESGHFSFTPAFWASFPFDAQPYADALFSSPGFTGTEYIASDYETGSRYHYRAQLVALDEVVLEKSTGSIIPDILVRIGSKWLLVEVAVTNFVDAEKQAKIEALGLPAIEIDLSKARREVSQGELEELVIHGEQHKKWLHNPAFETVRSQRQQRYFDQCRPELERLHTEQLREEARQLGRAKWRAELATKSPAELALIEHRKQEFYRQNQRPITERMVSGLTPVQHIDDCPEAARQFHGKPYANLEWDCLSCYAFRGYSSDRTAIVCLHAYLKRKELGG